MKTRISKKLLAQLPAVVAEKVEWMAKDYQIKSVTIETKPLGHTVYFGEGDRIEMVYGEQSRGVEMISESTLGALGMRHEIGARVAVPAGTWVITVSYYQGYYMTLTNVGWAALAA